jgi:hypothetical protein
MENTKTVRDRRFVSLAYIIQELEKIYGINGDLTKSPILEVKKKVTDDVKSLSKSELAKRNQEATTCIILLAYESNSMRFYNESRLTFNGFVELNKMAKILIQFTKRKTITKKSLNDVSKIIRLLDYVEKSAKVRASLSYKYIRIFIVLLINSSTCNASIVADFILNQFVVRR